MIDLTPGNWADCLCTPEGKYNVLGRHGLLFASDFLRKPGTKMIILPLPTEKIYKPNQPKKDDNA